MKLRNKKTGVVGEVGYISASTGDIIVSNIHDQEEWYHYKSLAELNEEWCDVEEPKGTYFINTQGDVQFWDSSSFAYPDDWTKEKEIGNCFETKEEAEKAVRKLKAWKRLKDKGFRFDGYDVAHKSNGNLAGQIFYDAGNYCIGDVEKYLDLLFSGKDD